jgi:predicted PurR-regulated permease PerM
MPRIFSVRDNSRNVQDTFKENNTHKEKGNETGKGGNRDFGKKEKKQTLSIDLSSRTMLFILLILAFLFFGRQLISVILFVFLAFVIMSSVRPIVAWFQKRGLSKGISIGITYFLLIVITLALLVLVSVPFINQLAGLVSSLPQWINQSLFFLEDFSIAGYSFDVELVNEQIMEFVKGLPTADNFKNIATFVSEFFGIGAFLITSLIFSVYLVSEHDSFADILLIQIVSNEKRKRVRQLVIDVEKKLGNWVLGQGVVSLCATIFSFIVLSILKVPFALPLAMFTGLMDLIPNLGSTIAGFLMSLVALISVGPLNAVIVLAAYILYQPLENGVITPRVMGNAVGLKPIIVLLGVIICITFFGVLGGFIAVPLMVVISILYEFYIDLQKLEAKGIV